MALTVKVSYSPSSSVASASGRLALEPLRLLLEFCHTLLGAELVGAHHHRVSLRRLGLGQSLRHVAQLVRAGALRVRSALEPSIMNTYDAFSSMPRSISRCSRSLTTCAFSLASRARPSRCLSPASSAPTVAMMWRPSTTMTSI